VDGVHVTPRNGQQPEVHRKASDGNERRKLRPVLHPQCDTGAVHAKTRQIVDLERLDLDICVQPVCQSDGDTFAKRHRAHLDECQRDDPGEGRRRGQDGPEEHSTHQSTMPRVWRDLGIGFLQGSQGKHRTLTPDLTHCEIFHIIIPVVPDPHHQESTLRVPLPGMRPQSSLSRGTIDSERLIVSPKTFFHHALSLKYPGSGTSYAQGERSGPMPQPILLFARNPGPLTGPGNNTWLLDGDEPTLIDAGTGAPEHLSSIAAHLGD